MQQKSLRMIGHGAIVLFIGLIAGFGLTIELVGGLEIIPTHIIDMDLPSDSSAWARAHVGGITNALLIFVFAILIHVVKVSERVTNQLFWMLIGTGYANTIFYYGGIFAGAHRAVSLGDNQMGASNIAGIIGFLPAFIFAFVLLVATVILMREAFRLSKESNH